MQNVRNKLIAGTALLILAAIGTVMNRQAAQAAGGPTVTIDQSQLPLPVQGSLSVSGTVAATQSGAWNVGISGTPKVVVSNPASTPVLTAAVDNPALQPFQFQGVGSSMNFGFPVPTGKTLVIEQVNFSCTQSAVAVTDFRLLTTANGVSVGYNFAPTTISASGASIVELVVNQMTRIYADGNTLVSMGAGGSTGSGPNTCGAAIGGYLVSAS